MALVMELVEGEDLAQRLRRGPIPLADALPIARQIAEALECAHELGIVHRDLKPANVKVRPDGTVKVLDFGLAKAIDPTASSADAALSTTMSGGETAMGTVMGTAAYMSPEQAKGRPVDKRADVWAFGAVLYEMVTGRRAFRGEDITDTLDRRDARHAGLVGAAAGLAVAPAVAPRALPRTRRQAAAPRHRRSAYRGLENRVRRARHRASSPP